jgi:hypothetical protein
MVEAGDKSTQKPPSAEELARAEQYAAMMEAIARDEDEFDLDEGDFNDEELADLDKQKQYLLAQQYARQYQGMDPEELQQLTEEQLMHQMHQQRLMQQQMPQPGEMEALLQLKAAELVKQGIDPA